MADLESFESLIDIHQLREAGEDGGGFLGWYAKGHHDKETFCYVVNSSEGLTPDSRRFIQTRHVRHLYYRTQMISGEDSQFQFVECKGPTRGAWAATVADLNGYYIDQQNKIQTEGRDAGRRQAINWTLDRMRDEQTVDLVSAQAWLSEMDGQ